MYAVIRDGSLQLKVSQGDLIEIERVGLKPGDAYTFNEVLALNKDGKTTFGKPTVPNAKVVGEVVEEFKGEKLVIHKYKKRDMATRTLGHRQRRTRVRIVEITG